MDLGRVGSGQLGQGRISFSSNLLLCSRLLYAATRPVGGDWPVAGQVPFGTAPAPTGSEEHFLFGEGLREDQVL